MRVMIADDETVVRRGIIDGIDWKKYGISEVSQAENGEDCLKIMSETQVDVLITDIRMPRVNGVDLGKSVSERFPDCAIIFISAYTDKEYLKSAISLNVVAYVEKPISLDELSTAIEKACSIVSDTHKRNETRHFSQVFRALLMKKTGSVKTADLGKIAGKAVCCALFCFKNSDEWNMYGDKEAINKIFSCHDVNIMVFGDILKEYYIGVCWCDDGSDPQERCRAALGEFSANYCAGHLFAAIGITQEVKLLYDSFLSAQMYLERMFYTPDCIISACRQENPRALEYTLSPAVADRLRYALFNRVKHEYIDAVGLFEKELTDRFYTISSAKNAALAILNLIQTYIPEYEYDFLTIEKVARCGDLGELIKLLIKESEHIVYYCDAMDPVCIEAVRVISEDYSKNELSLSYICTKLNIGKSKLCSQFRQGTGKSVNEYITEYRIAVAKELIGQGGMQVKDVAGMIGYNDINYFSKVFKKQVGVLPGSYKGLKEE